MVWYHCFVPLAWPGTARDGQNTDVRTVSQFFLAKKQLDSEKQQEKKQTLLWSVYSGVRETEQKEEKESANTSRLNSRLKIGRFTAGNGFWRVDIGTEIVEVEDNLDDDPFQNLDSDN